MVLKHSKPNFSYEVDLTKIGRLEIGTETLVDKSKSVKRYLIILRQLPKPRQYWEP